MEVRRLGYAMGARVTGVDLKAHLSDGAIASIRAAWLEHIVLCFPSQDLTPEEQSAFTERFGEIDDRQPNDDIRPPGPPGIIVLANKPITVGDADP